MQEGRRHPTLLLALVASLSLSLGGCVAAVLPIGAAALLGKKEVERRTRYKRSAALEAKAAGAKPSETGAADPAIPSTGAEAVLDTVAVPPASTPDANAVVVPPLSEAPLPPTASARPISTPDSIAAFSNFLSEKTKVKGVPASGSVLLAPFTNLANPKFTLCEKMPPAILVDLDGDTETSVPVNEALVDALDTARDQGIKVIYIASISEKEANFLKTDLVVAGLGPANRGDTLSLVGDEGTRSKDALHWKIGSSNCIVAMIGDRYDDFSGLLAQSPSLADPGIADPVRKLSGAGWFILPAMHIQENGAQENGGRGQ